LRGSPVGKDLVESYVETLEEDLRVSLEQWAVQVPPFPNTGLLKEKKKKKCGVGGEGGE